MNDKRTGCLTAFVVIVIALAVLYFSALHISAAEAVPVSHHLAGVDPDLIWLLPEEEDDGLTCLGRFTVSGYCSCELCCGKDDGITATGTQATAGRTIAVDPDVIPLGSVVVIGGREYIAEDIGGAIKGNHIDLYFDTHDKAVKWGLHDLEVWIYE